MARPDRFEGGSDGGAVEQVEGAPAARRIVERPAGEAVDFETQARQRRQRLPADKAAGASDEDAGHGSKSGKAASRALMWRGSKGQAMAKAGSFQRTPRARSGTYSVPI